MPRKTTKSDTETNAVADGAIAESPPETTASESEIANPAPQAETPTTATPTESPGGDGAIATSTLDVTPSDTSTPAESPPPVEMVNVEPLPGKTIDGQSGQQKLPKARAEFLSSKGMCQIVDPTAE